MRVLRYVPVLLLVALGVAAPAAASGGGPRLSVVATGLDSPRHLAFGSRGDLFVAEAGRGGSGPCFIGGEGPACMGASGAVTKIDRWGRQSRIADGLASMANTPGNDSAIGPHGIIGARKRHGRHHQRRPDGAAGPRRQHDPARDAGGPEPRRQPVREGPADRPARTPDPDHRHLGLRTPRQPGRRDRQPGDRLQPGRPDARRLPARRRRRRRQRHRRRRPARPHLGPHGVREPARPEPVRSAGAADPDAGRADRRSKRARTTSTTSASSPASRSRSAARTSTA